MLGKLEAAQLAAGAARRIDGGPGSVELEHEPGSTEAGNHPLV